MKPSGLIISSFVLTVLIFALGILLNYGLDFVRIGTINDVMVQHEIGTKSYIVEQEFTDSFGGNRCDIMQARIAQLKEDIQQVGVDLGSYSSFSFFKKTDYDYLKRKYFLLELRFLTLLDQLNRECRQPYVPILFFYQIDDAASERQGFVLEDLSKDYKQQVVVLSLDKDYSDEPLVPLLAVKYNVTQAPTVILQGNKYEGFVSTGLLNATIRQLLRRADPFGKEFDFQYVLNAAGRNVTEFVSNLSTFLAGNLSVYARADIMLLTGRITKNDTFICESLPFYDQAFKETVNLEKQALIAETIASLDCGRNVKAFLREAELRWEQLNASARAHVDHVLATGQKLNLVFNATDIIPNMTLQNASQIIIGKTSIVLKKGDKVLTQADRVRRDWLGLQMADDLFGNQILTKFSERQWYNASELREDIGWHEGGRMKELVGAGISPVVAYGTLAARHNDHWYAMDDQGVFSFEVPLDKMVYPTTRFLRDDLAVLMDTHGVNMLVEQSIRNKVDAVLSDCDHPGKVKAAQYLSEHGIPVVCFPDKYAYMALGHNLRLLGSPPVKIDGANIIFGNQSINISVSEPVVVMNATSLPYALWYYQTPANYFGIIAKSMPMLNAIFVQINDFNQMKKVVDKAEEINASVIAARVFNSNDYSALKSWLQQSSQHRAILFHSASYPYGYLLLKEFPQQTGFDDPNPRFIP